MKNENRADQIWDCLDMLRKREFVDVKALRQTLILMFKEIVEDAKEPLLARVKKLREALAFCAESRGRVAREALTLDDEKSPERIPIK